MAKLVYLTNMSLDGYIEDKNGGLDWADLDEVHAFVVELLQPFGAFVYGRRLYEAMAYWDQPQDEYPPHYREFARVWQKADKIVFSRTLKDVATRKTRLERDFDAGIIQKLKRDCDGDITIGGAELAGLALDAGLVDECHLLVHPVIFGGGKPAFRTTIMHNLEVLETRRVKTAVMYLRYRVRV